MICYLPSNQVTSQAQTASRTYQDGGPREVRTSVMAFFGRRKKYIQVSRILFYAKYLLFSIFRAFSAIFTLRVEDPFKMCKVVDLRIVNESQLLLSRAGNSDSSL